MFKKIICLCLVSLILTSCSSDNKNEQEISSLKDQILNLQSKIDLLQNDVDRVDYQLIYLTNHSAIFTPSSKGYATIYTGSGYFLLAMDGLNKYANGYKATFRIGNPSFITFNNVKVRIMWGVARPDSNLGEWFHSLKSQEITIDKPLLPGTWNNITVVLSPADAKETGYISLELTTDTVYLSSDTRK